MAGVSDYFAIGSLVACKTCYNTIVEGEVQAFDPQTKMLILSILLIRRLKKLHFFVHFLASQWYIYRVT